MLLFVGLFCLALFALGVTEAFVSKRGRYRSLRGGKKKHLRKYYSSRGGIRL